MNQTDIAPEKTGIQPISASGGAALLQEMGRLLEALSQSGLAREDLAGLSRGQNQLLRREELLAARDAPSRSG